MKKFLFCICTLSVATLSLAQINVFERMNYQATLRENGELMVNQEIDVRFIFIDTNASDAVFSETHTVTTNDYGMFTALIGNGTEESGSPASINRADEFLVEIDAGSGYVGFGSTPLGTAPRAQVARGVDNSYIFVGEPMLILTNNPTLTVGGFDSEGGQVLIGDESQFIEIDCGLASDDYGVINAVNAGGNGDLLIQADRIRIGSDAEAPAEYGLDMEVSSAGFGFNLRSSGSEFNWENYVSNTSGDLRLYTGSSHVGTFNMGSGAYTSISDQSTKKAIEPMSSSLEKVLLLEPKRYEFKKNNPTQRKSLGFIAQDVKEIFPELVFENELRDGEGVIHTMDYSGFGVIAIAAIQEQQEQIQDLHSLIETLQAEVKELKK